MSAKVSGCKVLTNLLLKVHVFAFFVRQSMEIHGSSTHPWLSLNMVQHMPPKALVLPMVCCENLQININIILFRLSSFSGYFSNVSPGKTSKGLKQKYFNFTLTDDANMHCSVCFSPKKHKLLSSIEERQPPKSAIELRNF